MGLNPPNTVNSCRTGDQICTYLNSTYPYIPAASTVIGQSRSRPLQRNYAMAEGIPPANHSPNPPLKGCAQPHHNICCQSHYSYVPAGQRRGHATGQNWNGPALDLSRDQRKHQAPNHKPSEPVEDTRTSSCASFTHAVAMTFVPKQPAKQAITFQPSLFQRDDPSIPPSESEQHIPLSELTISLNMLNRHLSRRSNPPFESAAHQAKPSRNSVHKPPRQSGVCPPRSSLPPPALHPLRRKHDSENCFQLCEKDRDVVNKALLNPRRLSRASAYPTRSTRK